VSLHKIGLGADTCTCGYASAGVWGRRFNYRCGLSEERLSQMRVCDGEPNNTSGLGQGPSHRPRRLAHTLRPGAFPSLIAIRIAHSAPNRNDILITTRSSRRRLRRRG